MVKIKNPKVVKEIGLCQTGVRADKPYLRFICCCADVMGASPWRRPRVTGNDAMMQDSGDSKTHLVKICCIYKCMSLTLKQHCVS